MEWTLSWKNPSSTNYVSLCNSSVIYNYITDFSDYSGNCHSGRPSRIVGIFILISRENFLLSWVEHESTIMLFYNLWAWNKSELDCIYLFIGVSVMLTKPDAGFANTEYIDQIAQKVMPSVCPFCYLQSRGGSNEYQQSMFWAKIRKRMYTPVNPSFTISKWGLKGSKLYRHVFMMSRKCHNYEAHPSQSTKGKKMRTK